MDDQAELRVSIETDADLLPREAKRLQNRIAYAMARAGRPWTVKITTPTTTSVVSGAPEPVTQGP